METDSVQSVIEDAMALCLLSAKCHLVSSVCFCAHTQSCFSPGGVKIKLLSPSWCFSVSVIRQTSRGKFEMEPEAQLMWTQHVNFQSAAELLMLSTVMSSDKASTPWCMHENVLHWATNALNLQHSTVSFRKRNFQQGNSTESDQWCHFMTQSVSAEITKSNILQQSSVHRQICKTLN